MKTVNWLDSSALLALFLAEPRFDIVRACLADAIIAVQAMAASAELIHKDPEFEAIIGLRQRPLPYETQSRRNGIVPPDEP